MVVAVLVNEVWRSVGIVVRTILFIPGIVSFVVTGVLWKLIYDPNVGTLNRILGSLGLHGLQHTWLADRSTVLPALIAVAVWGGVGMNMLIFFAGIQGIDPGLYEAAQVDGAGPFQRFWNITVPGLRVVTGIVVSLGLLNGFKIFDIIYVMTGGGPNHASEVFGTYLYNLAFGSTSGALPQLGYASAFSVRGHGAVHPRRHHPDGHHPEGRAVTATLSRPAVRTTPTTHAPAYGRPAPAPVRQGVRDVPAGAAVRADGVPVRVAAAHFAEAAEHGVLGPVLPALVHGGGVRARVDLDRVPAALLEQPVDHHGHGGRA